MNYVGISREPIHFSLKEKTGKKNLAIPSDKGCSAQVGAISPSHLHALAT